MKFILLRRKKIKSHVRVFTNGQYRCFWSSFNILFKHFCTRNQIINLSILLSWLLLTLIKSHLFSKFLILFWVELIQLSLWIQALKLFFFYFIKHVWEIIPPGNNKTAELPKVRKLGIMVSFWVTSQLSISCLPIKESEKEASFNWIYSRCNKKNLPGKVVPKLMFFSGVSFFID